MNLDQIATKCFILALFIRDDGERLLLGDGFYDFKSNLQHFQANTIANDIVELQGDNGQLLAGQVMRSGVQKFEGYIGDATTNRQTIEQKRSDFMAFFRIKHFYKVIYILPDGTAIQRQRGYLTDAPVVPEIFQKFPEYHIALNFEDVNYYEYAEDEHGDEIYTHIIELALSGDATGGLVWDAIGAVSNGITWSGIQTAQGEYISITNELSLEAPLASVEMLGNAEQDGTPTPDSPVPVQVVTGEQTVAITGKNLFDASTATQNYRLGSSGDPFADNDYYLSDYISVTQNTAYYISGTSGAPASSAVCFYASDKSFISRRAFVNDWYSFTTPANTAFLRLTTLKTNDINQVQLELGNSASTYEQYQAQEFEVNLGKNLLDPDSILQGTWINPSLTNTCTFFMPIFTGETFTISNQDTATYRFSCGLCATPHAGTNTQDSGWQTGTSYTITAQSNGYLYVQLRRNDAGTITPSTVPTNVYMVERGTSATSYSAYFTPIELCKIGTYQDYIWNDGGTWKIHKAAGKVVLDGSESWNFTSNGNAWYITSWASNNNALFPSSDNVLSGSLSNNFTNIKRSDTASSEYGIGLSSNAALFIKHSAYITSGDSTQFKTWLASNPTAVYYALATPTTTEITNEALITQLDALESASLYLGVNNIGTETPNAVPTLKIEYYTEVDLDGAGYEWEAGGNTAKTIVTVAGVDSAWPIWTVQGGAQNPTLTNITTGQTISWQGFVPEGQTLTINMAEMTADLAGANVFEYITGEWIRLAPGNNTLVYTAGSADKTSTLSWNGVLA